MNIEDLYTVDVHDIGAEMRLRDQNGKYTDMYITVSGIDSKKWRSEKRKMHNAGLEIHASKDKDLSEDELFETADKLTAESLAAITLSWRGFKSKGKELEFSKEKAIELYTCAPYIREQVDLFFSNRANFTKG